MNRLRNKSILRTFIALLVLCLATVVVSPAAMASGRGTGYAEWLRLHFHDASKPEVQRAIDLASETSARSIDEFLSAFVDELDSITSSSSGRDPVDDDRNKTEQLLQELRFQFTRFVGKALLVRQSLVSSSQTVTSSKELRTRKTANFDFALGKYLWLPGAALGELATRDMRPVFLLSSMQPLGP